MSLATFSKQQTINVICAYYSVNESNVRYIQKHKNDPEYFSIQVLNKHNKWVEVAQQIDCRETNVFFNSIS